MKPKFIRFVLGTAIGLASALAPLRAQFAYVTNFSDSNVSAYTIDPATGALTAIPGSPFSAGADPVSVAVDPSGKFVYVANNAVGNIVSGFTIDPTGALTVIAGSPFSAGKQPNWVAVDPSGKFAYVANAGDNTVSGTRSTRGHRAPTAIAGSPFAAGLWDGLGGGRPDGFCPRVGIRHMINPPPARSRPSPAHPSPQDQGGRGRVDLSGKFATGEFLPDIV
jgi:sugar lactone lactonase YvrE